MKKNDKIFNKAVEKLQKAGSRASLALSDVSSACDGLRNVTMNLDEMHTVGTITTTKEKIEEITKGKIEEGIKLAEQQEAEEWIWVKGYKGTDRDMKCRDYQFMFNYRHDMIDGAEIKLCESGFHFCPKIKDVFQYYEIGNGNRFFEVRALVRKKDYEKLKPSASTMNVSFNGMTIPWPTWANPWAFGNDKLTSKAIEFVRELTLDEIFADTDAAGWSEENKKLALEVGIGEARKMRDVMDLTALGYSEQLSHYIVYELGKYNLAKFLTTLPENPSMDTKMIILFSTEDDCPRSILEKKFNIPQKYKTVTLTKDDIISPSN